jgi:hypothetical protein
LVVVITLGAAAPAAAQHEGHDMGAAFPPMGSGTAWLPAATPQTGWHLTAGAWSLMLHGSAFAQYVRESGTRGNYQFGVVNWLMAEARRPALGGTLGLRVMASAEALTLTDQGYPQLLQVAQPYKGGMLANRMHPHEMVSEAAVTYEHVLTGDLHASLYLGAVGEPALGPVAYLHRPSAVNEPSAPLGHHYQDVTHESFGVLTAGLFTRTVRIEASLFNGAHGDEVRTNFEWQGARINATAVRFAVNPSAKWSVAASGAYLPATQGPHAHGPLRRLGISIMNVAPRGHGAWSTTLIWGANVPTATGKALHSVLFETNLDLDSKNTIFGRAEYSGRTAEELDLVGSIDDEIAVGRVGVGVARRVAVISGLTGWLGIRGSMARLPGQLEVFYGSRSPLGFTAYLQVRPPRTP